MRAVVRLRDFRLLFAGLAASMIGDALMLLVFAIWVKRLTGSSSAAGLVILFVVVPYAVGPLGGWLIDRFRPALFATLGGPAVAAIDAVSFLIAAAAISRMRLHEEPARPTALRWSSELTAGLSLIRSEPALRRTMTSGAIAFLVIGLNESIVFALVDQGLHRPPEFIGVLAAAQGIGAITGGLLVARLITRSGERAATAIGLAAFGIGDALCVFPWLASVLAGRVVSGFGLSVMFVGLTTVLQRHTPGPLLGRVSLAAETIISGPQMISIAAGAVLVSVVDYRLLLMIVTTGMLAGATYLWKGRQLTRPPQRTTLCAT